jgi:hypothetical protein
MPEFVRQGVCKQAFYLEFHKNKSLEISALFDYISSKDSIKKDLNGHDRMLRVLLG